MKVIKEGLTFDDVLLIPAHSLIMPNQVILKTNLTKSIQLNIPIVSAAMDSVTESRLAVSLALQGGIGMLHRHMSSEEQLKQVTAVKKTLIDQNNLSLATLDSDGCLRVGAAVGTDQSSQERVRALADAKVDIIVVDTAHGHSDAVLKMVEWIKITYPRIQVIGGNIVTARAARALADHGADCVKVGIGPGAACTTRIVTGVGYPQLSAIQNVAQELEGTAITIIADGGIRFSGDIGKALAAGADSVMLGQLLAGTDEAPGEILHENGNAYKIYRGMHSLGALADKHSTDDLHFKQTAKKLVPEGAEGKVPYKGALHEWLYQLLGGIRSCMGYCGCQTIEQLQQAEFVRITAAGIKESHVHNITLTNFAPNYAPNT